MITEEVKMKTTRDPYILGLESADRLYKGEKLSRTPKRGTTHNIFQAGTKEHQDWEEGFNFHHGNHPKDEFNTGEFRSAFFKSEGK